jgi:hypothetical protein
VAGGEDAYIGTFVHDPGFADFKFLVGGSEVGHHGAAEAQVHGAFVVGDGKGSGLGLVVVAGVDDGHAGQHFHHAEVFQNLVGGPVFAQREAGVGGADFYILAGVSNALANLVVDAAGAEIGKRAREGDFAANGHAGGHAHHVGLSDTDLEKPLGVGLFKGVHLERAGEVGAEGHHVGVGVAQLGQASAEAAAGVFRFGVGEVFHGMVGGVKILIEDGRRGQNKRRTSVKLAISASAKP